MTRGEIINFLPKNLVWVELGVFMGDFSKEIYRKCNPSELYLVDIFPEYMCSGDKDGNNIEYRDLTNVPINLVGYFNDSNVNIVKSDTISFLKKILYEKKIIDVVYIDAEHTYNSVFNELLLSYDIISKNGYLCGHDYCEKQFKGVFDAVNDFCSLKNLTITYLSNDSLPSYFIKML